MKKHIPNIIIFLSVFIFFIFAFFYYGSTNIFIYNILLYLFAAPLLEEVIFRGFIQNKLKHIVKSYFLKYISLSNIITSIIFMLCHFIINLDIILSLLIFIPSIYLGFLYDYYNKISIPVFFHSFFNIIVFINIPYPYI